jgi:hypothetical protein
MLDNPPRQAGVADEQKSVARQNEHAPAFGLGRTGPSQTNMPMPIMRGTAPISADRDFCGR